MFNKIITFFKNLFSKNKSIAIDNKIDIESIKVESKGSQVFVTVNDVTIPAKVTYEHSEEGELFGYFANGPGCYVVTLEDNEFGIVDASIWTSRKEGGDYIGVSLWLETFGPGVTEGYVTYERFSISKEVRHNKRSIKFNGELVASVSRITNKKAKLRGFKDKSHKIPVQFDLRW